MRSIFASALGCLSFVAAALLFSGQPAAAQTNLLSNGSFEVNANGYAFPDGPTASDWRLVAGAVGGTGSATLRSAAATAGSVGLELVHSSGNFWFDRWDSYAPIQNRPGVYMLLVDAKDGGIHGGQDNFVLDAVVHNSNATYPEYTWACEPGAAFETWGVVLPVSSLALGVDARLTPSTTADQSFYADNIRVHDVTNGNRVLNPGFEYSTSRYLHWRNFSVGGTGTEFSSVLSGDAHSGAQAVQITRSDPGGVDGGFDNFANRIPVIPGERLKFEFYAKKVSGDAATRLAVFLPQYDAAGTFTGTQATIYAEPTGAYGHFAGYLTVGPTAATISYSFRVGDNVGGVYHLGSYLIDDLSVQRSTNLMDGGDFEAVADNVDSVPQWREPWPTSCNLITRAAGASEGRMGAELDGIVTPFFVDRWDTPNLTGLPTLPGVYKLVGDFKDGGTMTAMTSLQFGLYMHAAPYPGYVAGVDPAAAFETFGITAPAAADRTGADVRLTPNVANESCLVDNFRIIDVTRSNRAVNGGFENSASRIIGYRTYSLNAGEMTFALSNDAHSGSNALRLERTYAGAGDNDAAIDLFNDRIGVLPSETLNISVWAKKLSGDANARLALIITDWDSAGALVSTLTISLQEPGANYGHFNVPITTSASAASINIGLAVLQPDTGRHVGAYLVDDLEVMRNSVPSAATAALQYTGPDEMAVKVATTGWTDADADAEMYTYQWKLNNVNIPGATMPVIDKSIYGNTGSLTCVVTPFDGISSGSSIETAPLVVPVEVSSFELE